MSSSVLMATQQAEKIITNDLQPQSPSNHAYNLGEILIRIGCLDPGQVKRVRKVQAQSGRPFGRTAVKMGLLAPQDLKYALGVQFGILRETTDPVSIPAALVVVRNPFCREAEEFNLMRTTLMTGSAQDKLDLISIAGADARSRAAYVAANLAASFAQLGRRVALIDADLRKPKLAKMFGAHAATGVTDIANGVASYEDSVRATLVKKLDLLTAGAPTRDPQSILSGGKFIELLDRARQDHDSVIVLASPFEHASDGQFVWAATKNVIALARKDHTRAETLSRMRSVMRGVGAEIIGAALTA